MSQAYTPDLMILVIFAQLAGIPYLVVVECVLSPNRQQDTRM